MIKFEVQYYPPGSSNICKIIVEATDVEMAAQIDEYVSDSAQQNLFRLLCLTERVCLVAKGVGCREKDKLLCGSSKRKTAMDTFAAAKHGCKRNRPCAAEGGAIL